MTRKEALIIAAARQWWANRRPLSFTIEQHLDNPTINCVSDAEKTLARAVASIYGQTRQDAGLGTDRTSPKATL